MYLTKKVMNKRPKQGLFWKPNLSGNTIFWNGECVVKSYGSRLDHYYREYALLKKLKNTPLPAVLDSTITGELHMEYIDGINGKEVAEIGKAIILLKEMGKFLHKLHSISVEDVDGILDGKGNVIVHGDFAYYNCIFNNDCEKIIAVLDWEEAYLGDAITDLAWCEWQFLNKFPQHKWAISNLFDSYGNTPNWDLRQQAVQNRLVELQNRM